ncbi:MAG TPA: hypothetical protein DDX92_11665 [Flavobacteriales bacterium]|jgi:hypothetical protein|nr:hypothetical protein [Flavobacteriales bacterium]
MGFKSFIARPYAKMLVSKHRRRADRALVDQDKWMKLLVSKGKETAFGRAAGLAKVHNYPEFKNAVALADYEELKAYIDRAVEGESDVLWPERPLYFCKTSGTTSGAKYIPITRDSVDHHVDAAKMALLYYIMETGNSAFLDGKMMFLQGSPNLEDLNGVPLGRLSGITAHWVPSYLQRNRMPSWETNLMEDWEAKVDRIVEETMAQDMRLLSGIPSWMQMYFERMLARTGKDSISEVFPNFSLFVHGGVNYAPYRSIFRQLIGKEVDTIETYPASEGFIAFQNEQNDEGLLLNTDAGMFYEFIPMEQFHSENPERISLHNVELDRQYAIVLNTNAGLWGYLIGDTVKFTSLDPFKIRVTGRTRHFTSAFGEHVIAEEVDASMSEACAAFNVAVREFHLAPEVKPEEGLPYHEWYVEFDSAPDNLKSFEKRLDEALQKRNPYYRDLILGNVLKCLVIRVVVAGGFTEMMKSRGKLGGQNKIPRLANDQEIGSLLRPYTIS